MTHGLDTGFLVAAEVMEHAENAAATHSQAGIESLLTTHPADFGVSGAFTCITPKPASP